MATNHDQDSNDSVNRNIEECLDLTEEIQDPHCDEKSPRKVIFDEVQAAARAIKGKFEKSPCTRSKLSAQLGLQLYFKNECIHPTGSFKERGGCYALSQLSPDQAKKGVIAASSGNFAQALAYRGRMKEIPVTVVMPKSAPQTKVQACKNYGASVEIQGSHVGEAKSYAMALGKKRGLMYVNGYDHPHFIAGQGTVGLEVTEQVPDLDACIIPVGGGGLIAGSSVALKTLKPGVKIIGVESETSTGFLEALAAGHPVTTSVGETLADGLAIPKVGCNSLATAQGNIDKMVTVSESFIAQAVFTLLDQEKAVVEGAGAAGLAAIMEGLVPELQGKKVVVVLCGRNIDTTKLAGIIEGGLTAQGHLVRFGVTAPDRPDITTELSKRIREAGAGVRDFHFERSGSQTEAYSVMVRCEVETRDRDHARELIREIRKDYGVRVFSRDEL